MDAPDRDASGARHAAPPSRDPAVVERVRSRLAAEGAEPTAARVAAALRAEGRLVGDSVLLDIVAGLQREVSGAGPLEPLLRDPSVSDVLVNAPDEVWVDRGCGLERAAVSFPDDGAVRRLAQRLAAMAGRRLDDAAPWVDARLPGGARLHAVLQPVATRATCISLRVTRPSIFTLDALVAAGSVTSEGEHLLRALVGARRSFLVTGGTGTGKTTLLTALLGRVPARERLLVVEESGEVRPAHPHVVRLEARPPNVEGAGAVTLRDLVRQALRMRPDRIVVGEVRGGEVVELLAALNTGHEGGCGTLHANTAADVPARVEALALAAGLDRPATHSQLVAGVEAIVHMLRDGEGRRRVGEMAVLRRGGDGEACVQTAVRFAGDGTAHAGPGAERLDALLARAPR